jgi:hypothetical protein
VVDLISGSRTVTYRFKRLEHFDVMSNFIRKRTEFNFDVLATQADNIRTDIELLGFAPPLISHDCE